MKVIGLVLTVFVALEHIYILILEMFLWTKPKGLKAFGLAKEFAITSQGLAANQGLYNGFLAAGLLWGIVHPNAQFGLEIRMFFLGCVVVAGMYGGITVKKSIESVKQFEQYSQDADIFKKLVELAGLI